MKPVLTKKNFVKRYQKGEFGNRSPTWSSLDEMNKEGILETCPLGSLYHIRNRIAGGPTWYNLRPTEVTSMWNRLDSHSNLYISQMAPTDRTLIQGEVARCAGGLLLRYTTVAKPMRDALATSQEHVRGAYADALLQYYLCDRSYEWLQYLLDSYEDHVIEFSTYGVNFGTVPGVNTVWWEIRKY